MMSPCLSFAPLAAACLLALPAAAETGTRLEFEHLDQGMPKSVIIVMAPSHLRADRARDRFGVIYQDEGEVFTGLEMRDGKYWRFAWPAVQAAVNQTSRNKNLLSGGLDLDGGLLPDEPAKDTGSGLPTHEYTWKATGRTDLRRGWNVAEWIGESNTGKQITAWATAEDTAGFPQLMERLGKVNGHLEMAVVRSILPQEFFIACRDLRQQDLTPMDITIGGGPVEGRERVFLKSRVPVQVEPDQFAVPESFQETESVAMQGIFNEVPEEKPMKEQNIFNRQPRGPLIPNAR